MKKSQEKQLDKDIIRALTEVCEWAKYEVDGFQWVTHQVDYNNFPRSLLMTWVFDNQAQLLAAKESEQAQQLFERATATLEQVGVTLTDIRRHCRFDSEEQCLQQHRGDWDRRLS